MLRSHVATSTPQQRRDGRERERERDACECAADCRHRDGTYRGVVLHKDGTELSQYCIALLTCG
jgi:hypothetical protein